MGGTGNAGSLQANPNGDTYTNTRYASSTRGTYRATWEADLDSYAWE
jgi:hypothetical protein